MLSFGDRGRRALPPLPRLETEGGRPTEVISSVEELPVIALLDDVCRRNAQLVRDGSGGKMCS